MDPGFLIGEEDAARLAAMLNQFECGKLGAVETPPVIGGTSEQPNVAYAKVTSGTPSYSYYYPAKRVYRHLGDWVEAEAIWLRGLNGETLENGKYYQARFFNMSPTLEPSAIYATQVQASSIIQACVVKPTVYANGWYGRMLGYQMSLTGASYGGGITWVQGAAVGIISTRLGESAGTNIYPTIGRHYQGVFAGIELSIPWYAVDVEAVSGGTSTGMTTGGGLV